MSRASVEADSRVINIRIDRVSGNVELTGNDQTVAVEFGALPVSSGRITSKFERPQILTKEDMRYLTVYEHIAGNELSTRSGIEWTRQSEGFGGDTIASERSYSLILSKNQDETDFATATRYMLGRVSTQALQERVRIASLKLAEGKRMGEVDETAQIEVEKMQEEIDDMKRELDIKKSA